MKRLYRLRDDTEALIDEHVAWMRGRRMSPMTILGRRRTLRQLAEWLQPTSLLGADAHQLEAWQRSIGGGLAPRSERNYVCHVLGYYRWAMLHEKIPPTPDPTRLLFKPPIPPRAPKPITDEALGEVLDAATGDLRLMIALGALAGLRVAEMAVLQRSDILDTAIPPVIMVLGKGNKQRIVPMLPSLLNEIGQTKSDRGPLLRHPDGRPYTAERITQLISQHMRALGLQDTAHSLRHYYATSAYRMTHDLLLVQALLGHASANTTAGYCAYSDEAATVFADGFEAKMAPLLKQTGR